MKKQLKIFFYSLLVVVVLCVLGGFLAGRFINPNNYKDKITSMVHEKTGRDLVIQGQIELSFFPWLGVRVHDVQLANAAGFQPAQFASVSEIDVRVKLIPLLTKKIEIGRIVLRGLNLHLAKNTQGVTNWQDLISALTSAPASAKLPINSSTTITTSSTKSGLALASIAGVDIQNAMISWINAQKNQTVRFKNVQVKSDTPIEGRFFPFSVALDIQGVRPNIAGHINLSTDVFFDQNKANYQLKNPDIVFTPSEKDAQKMSLQAAWVLVDMKAETLAITNAILSSGSLNAKLNVQAQQILNKPVFYGQLNAEPFDLKGVLKTLGKSIETTNPNALQRVSLHTKFSGNMASIKLDPLNLQVDRSSVQGMFAITDFATLSFLFNLNVNQLNADDYLPPKSVSEKSMPIESGVSTAVTTSALSKNAKPNIMRQANIKGTVHVGKLIAMQTEVNELSVKIALQNGLAEINPLNANIYKGSMQGKVAINFRGALPKYEINESLSGIDIAQLVKSGRVIGKANVVTHLTLQGNDKREIIRNLNGNVTFNVQNGALIGTNVPYQVERAIALFKRQPAPPAPAVEDRTSFDVLQGTGTFAAGVFSNKDLLMQSSQFKGTGEGTANLVNETLNYRLRLVGLQTTTDAQGKRIQEERQTSIPVLISGTFDKPAVIPDLKVLIQDEVGQKAMEKIQEKLGPDAGRAVGGLLQQLLK